MLQEYLKGIEDKRQEGKVKHKLLEIIVMTICAVIVGGEIWEDIRDYCTITENQPTLYHGVEEYFMAALESIRQYPEVTSYKTMDCGHGRVEQRTYYL